MRSGGRRPNSAVLAAEAAALSASFPDERHIALAVSGGSDSVAMLRLAANTKSPCAKFSVLTVNHRLREASDLEAQWVSSLCAQLGLAHAVLRWEGAKPDTGLQAKARQARYDLMTSWCLSQGATSLLTAHTRDDQAETVAMRLRRTQTALSLAGIRSDMDWNGVMVRRPLLDQRREDLRNYLRSIGQGWIEDPSNANLAFERVRVRHELAGDASLADMALEAASATRATEQAADVWRASHLQVFPEGYGVVDRHAFRSLDTAVQQAVLRRMLRDFGGSHATPSELQSLADWIIGSGNSRRTLGGAIFASRTVEVIVGREWSRIRSQTIPASGHLIWDGRFHVSGEAGTVLSAAGHAPQLPRLAHVPRFVQDGLPAFLEPVPSLAGAAFIPRLR
jgi:tRNA(Ile)-lysidine synthase